MSPDPGPEIDRRQPLIRRTAPECETLHSPSESRSTSPNLASITPS